MPGALTRLLTARCAAEALGICRIGVGLAAGVRGLKTTRDLWLLQHDPNVVPAPPFAWSPGMSETWQIAAFSAVWFGAVLALTLGWRARLAAFTLVACALFLYGVDQNFWANHMYFLMVVMALLGLSQSDASLSIDWLRQGRVARDVPYWPIWLLKVQLSLVYFFTAVSKLNDAYLSGWVIGSRMELPDTFRDPTLVMALAVVALGIEFFLVWGLWLRATRRYAVAGGLLLHGLIPIAFGPYVGLIVFSLLVFSLYPLYAGTERAAPVLP